MKKSIMYTLISFALLLILLPGSFAQVRIDSLGISEQNQALLKTEGKITSSGKSIKDISLMPANTQLHSQLMNSLDSLKVRSVIESLHFIDSPKAPQPLALYSALLNITSLKGLEFYSRSESRMKELVYDVYFVDSFKSKKPIPNPTPAALEPIWQGVMMQDDETFGPKYYDVTIYTGGGEILMVTQNLQTLKQGPVTTAKPKEMVMAFHLIPTTNGLVLHQIIATAQSIPSFVRIKAETSLLNRQEAYKNWIKSIYLR